MTGPEHYQEAERLEAEGRAVVAAIRDTHEESRRDALGKKAMGIWAQAQVHATLAHAAADADLFALAGQRGDRSAVAWRAVLGL